MSLLRPTLNLGNSIVGVSILTMPWCFSQCGVVLGALLLVASALYTTWTCKMLLRAANIKRQPTYETLGLSVSGSLGKLGVELGNIGLGVGTCVGFFVIIGDLLPPLVAGVLGLDWVDPRVLRAVLLVLSAVFVAFPLTLIRSVDRLSVISVGSLGFYLFLIGQLVLSSRPQLSDWSSVTLWQFSGIFKCLPIFSLAFCCQSQMFVIYASLKENNARRMSSVVDGAVWMVMSAYLAVAVFGYMSYHTSNDIHGDILANFPYNSISQITRFGFSVTVMLSFPLIVFPCRVSINSLFCPEVSMELHVTPPIPQSRFVAITAGVMAFTLVIAIIIPNIQVVLALVGSTLGSLICFILPGLFFIKAAGSNTDYSLRAKFSIVLGLCVLVLSTMVTLNSWSNETEIHYHIKPPPPVEELTTPPASLPIPDLTAVNAERIPEPNDQGQVHIDPPNDAINNMIIDSPNVEINNINPPNVEISKINSPNVEISEINSPNVEINKINSPDDAVNDDNPPNAVINDINPPNVVLNKESAEPAEPVEEVHEKLEENISQLAERVEKLEEENKDLKKWKNEEDKHALADERLKAVVVEVLEEKDPKNIPLDNGELDQQLDNGELDKPLDNGALDKDKEEFNEEHRDPVQAVANEDAVVPAAPPAKPEREVKAPARDLKSA